MIFPIDFVFSKEDYPKVRIAAFDKGKLIFVHPLDYHALPQEIGKLYHLPTQKIEVFGHDHIIFGSPS